MHTLLSINGKKFSIFKDNLKDVIYSDNKSNPVLWFVKDLSNQDIIVTGVKTKKEAIQAIYNYLES